MRPLRFSRSLRSTNSVTASPTASEAPTKTPKSSNVQVSEKIACASVKSQSAQKGLALPCKALGKRFADVYCPGVSCEEIRAFGHKMLPLEGKWLMQFSQLFDFTSNLNFARLL